MFAKKLQYIYWHTKR